jgi:hypothetical protein
MNSVSEAGRYRRAARQMGARPADTEKRRGLDRGQVSRGRKHLGSDHRRKVVCRSPRSGPIYRGPSGRRRACARAPRLSRPCDLTRSHRGRTGKQLRVLGVTGGVGRFRATAPAPSVSVEIKEAWVLKQEIARRPALRLIRVSGPGDREPGSRAGPRVFAAPARWRGSGL